MSAYYYHIYQRLQDKGVIFYDYADYLLYLTVLSVKAKQYKIKIIALCQMVNHIHILLVAQDQNDIILFMNDYTTTFSKEYNSGHGIKGSIFQSPYGRAPKRNGKAIRTCIAYVFNNPVEKHLCKEALEYRWDYLAYAFSKRPFSEKLALNRARKPMRRAIKEVHTAHDLNNYLTYRQIRRLFDNLNYKEKEQLCDRIISLYCPIDFEQMSLFYHSLKDAVIAINSNTGTEYDIDEEYDRLDYRNYSRFTQLLISKGKISSPEDILSKDIATKQNLAKWLKWNTNAPSTQIDLYLHRGGETLKQQ